MIKELSNSDLPNAVDIFTECFYDDPLHVYAFPDVNERERLTRIMYEFIIYHLVPGMFMKLYGYFETSGLAGVIAFSPYNPERKWNDLMQFEVDEMKARAKNDRINLIGDFSRESGSVKLPFDYCYANELGVLKKYRGKGIGGKLLAFIETETLKTGINYIALDTANKKNLELYYSRGYKLFKEYLFKELKCYKMYKFLN
jgi:GNAT superfamily N-acetyltransferase